ncbi:helix-turn-helix domain-containing protein [candidate division WOR-3 bacterium]|nr:helix-turn-helix domain-containing protein [candidate division WOR-3 bacterium]
MIAVHKAQGCSRRGIGLRMGRDKVTISRALRRNAPEIYMGYYLSHTITAVKTWRMNGSSKNRG